ncbi:hypothetical protein B9Z55_016909 [Caenorhabditis nigoni]|uniref:F-box associated domain-containing protein n=1 Tax=Caenorhabditis nigoni TaxID=1611254 RepID=A0A2G5T7N0_9PELO|nr:hypothetical protein B9Z55_016909 [Caenorhabditis nigoni]
MEALNEIHELKFDDSGGVLLECLRYNKRLAFDLAEGYDILREDGTLATIGILEDGFFFGVWHNRFHEIDGQEIWISRKSSLF